MNPSSTSKPEEELEWDVIPELESWSIEDDFFEMSLEEKMEVDDVPSLEALSDSDDSDGEEEDPMSAVSWG